MIEKKQTLTKLDKLIQQAFSELHIEKNYRVFPLIQNWDSVVGKTIAAKTRPHILRGNTLHISVVNSVWMNELELQKNMILKKIKSTHPDLTIDQIRFKINQEHNL